jgi:hypothetical protein
MGVSCGGKGKLTITDDDDVIERTNLSRQQFLFRDWNIEPSLQSTPTSVLMLFRTGHVQCDRTTSKMKGLSPKIISGDSRRSENAQIHTNKHTIPNMKFKLKLLQIK